MSIEPLTLNIKGLWDHFTGKPSQQELTQAAAEDMMRPAIRSGVFVPAPDTSELQSQVEQLKFLLASTPMIDAPIDIARVRGSSAPFAYIHPVTFAPLVSRLQNVGRSRAFYVFSGSPTKWVVTDLMPKGRVIYSPLQIPGLTKMLSE